MWRRRGYTTSRERRHCLRDDGRIHRHAIPREGRQRFFHRGLKADRVGCGEIRLKLPQVGLEHLGVIHGQQTYIHGGTIFLISEEPMLGLITPPGRQIVQLGKHLGE